MPCAAEQIANTTYNHPDRRPDQIVANCKSTINKKFTKLVLLEFSSTDFCAVAVGKTSVLLFLGLIFSDGAICQKNVGLGFP